MKKIISILIITILLHTTVTFATSQSLNDAKNKKNETQTELKEVQAEKSDIEKEISKLNDQIKQYESEITKLNSDINALNTDIQVTQQELEAAEKRYAETEQLFSDRMVALYESGETTYLDVLLNSNSITDFISNYYLISEIASYDNELMDSIEEEKTKIEIVKNSLEAKKTTLEASRKNKESTQTSLEASKNTKNSYVKVLSGQESDLKEKMAQYDKEIASIEAQMRAASQNNNSGSAATYNGQLLWPSPVTTISSHYGMRYLDLYGYWRLHAGVDIPVSVGTSVYASESGTVTTATYSSSYGYYIIISHGNGLATLYAHNSNLKVSQGQKVSRGDVIAASGNTGNSTGPHSHVEVWVNGSQLCPSSFFGYTCKGSGHSH